jgi:hypothetical protein
MTRDTIDMAREAGMVYREFEDEFANANTDGVDLKTLKAFVALVRADERNLWPAEMEAMERQVNILTDALAAERKACAKVVEALDGCAQYFPHVPDIIRNKELWSVAPKAAAPVQPVQERMKTTIDMAREAGVEVTYEYEDGDLEWGCSTEQLKAFAALVRADERNACLNCYSPDDTAIDWADKIRARSST